MTMDQEQQEDDRLAGLEKKVDEGFVRVDKDIRELRAEMSGLRSEMTGIRGEVSELRGETAGLRGEMNSMRSEIHMRLDGLQRAHYAGVVAIVAALIATSAF